MTDANRQEVAFGKAVDFALVVLAGTQTKRPEDLDQAVDLAIDTAAKLFQDVTLDRQRVWRAVRSSVSVFVGDASALGDDRGHEPWLNRRRSDIEWRFWNAYRRWLVAQGLPLEVVGRLDSITDDVLGRLEYPRREGAWDRRGMVVGQVQSGKTGNYTGLICKAADAGYKVIVVLAGAHNSLRSQTQRRLDEGFLGLDSRTGPGFAGSPQPIGVGAGGARHPSAITLTSSDEFGDFATNTARRIAARIDRDSPPVLLVIKKNALILQNLLDWIKPIHERPHPESGRLVIPDLPLLVIDDEADYASVNTREIELEVDESGKVLSETDPTAINRLVRQLLFAFEQSAYVGYTATPFANIFIYEDRDHGTYGEDLFPRSFIVRIPAPSNYLGPAELFGVAASDDPHGKGRRGLPIVRTIKDSDAWMPAKHDKHWRPGPPPRSLERAIQSFLLAGAARAARGQRHVHNSMLVHVTRFQDVQHAVHEQISGLVNSYLNDLRYAAGADSVALRATLQQLWESDFEQSYAGVPEDRRGQQLEWSAVEAELADAVARVEVREINGSAGDALEYADSPDGISVIAVGGNKLSRGLTLEGLTVSYYLRASKMYDTLMQMGRWFGYRPGYTDVCRLHTTRDLQLNYRNITIANEELLAKFDEMAAAGSSPDRFALYVRTSPDGLMVTAPAKMRKTSKQQMTFSENIVETTIFRRDVDEQTANIGLVEKFVREQTAAGRSSGQSSSGNFLWQSVPGEDVAALLEGWRTAQTGQKANGAVLAHYVRNRVSATPPELVDWTVALVNRRDVESTPFAGLDVGFTERGPDPDVEPPEDMFVIGRLVNPADERLDLKRPQLNEALQRTQQRWDAGNSRAKERPTAPSGASLRAIRTPQRGLLLIYPMTPNHVRLPDWDGPLVGFAVSFPRSPKAPTISYTVPNRYWQMDFGI